MNRAILDTSRIVLPVKKTPAQKLLAKAKREVWEDLFAKQLQSIGLTQFLRQYPFHGIRQWKFDFAFNELKLAIEIDGAVYTNGRHTRGKGFEEDCEKKAEAAILNWTVLNFSTGQVKSGYAIEMVQRWLKR